MIVNTVIPIRILCTNNIAVNETLSFTPKKLTWTLSDVADVGLNNINFFSDQS
jgi:hypothetical protein